MVTKPTEHKTNTQDMGTCEFLLSSFPNKPFQVIITHPHICFKAGL